jgi:hypothetical protein
VSVSVELDGFLMGDGTSYEVAAEGVAGLLGSPEVKTNDVDRGHADGAFAGLDFYGPRLITIPVSVLGDVTAPSIAADCLRKLEELTEAWAIVDDLSTLTLRVELWGRSYVVEGRPRPVSEDDLSNVKSGVALVTCEFFCPSPTVVTSS